MKIFLFLAGLLLASGCNSPADHEPAFPTTSSASDIAERYALLAERAKGPVKGQFEDGSFEHASQMQRSIVGPTGGIMALAPWNPRGAVELVSVDNQARVELSAGTRSASIGQPVSLEPNPQAVLFDAWVASAAAPAELHVFFNAQLLEKKILLPGASRNRVPLTGNPAYQPMSTKQPTGEIHFRLVASPAQQSISTLQLDNLRIEYK